MFIGTSSTQRKYGTVQYRCSMHDVGLYGTGTGRVQSVGGEAFYGLRWQVLAWGILYTLDLVGFDVRRTQFS